MIVSVGGGRRYDNRVKYNKCNVYQLNNKIFVNQIEKWKIILKLDNKGSIKLGRLDAAVLL